MMRRNSIIAVTTLSLMLLVSTGSVIGADVDGTVKLGGVLIDDEGNPGVNQSTFNTYEGVALSLENFSYKFDNGARLFANLKNITMNNRNLRLSFRKAGQYGVSLHNSQYRRLYSEDGSQFTRRRLTGGDVWVKPTDYLKAYGGYDLTERYGDQTGLLGVLEEPRVDQIDYTNSSIHGGVTFEKDRRAVDANYRVTSYTDDTGELSDRTSKRFRATVRTPVPRFDNVIVYGGFQSYCYRVDDSFDTLRANTGWFGGQAVLRNGFRLRGNFIWDRARRTGDLSASDNLATAFYVDKTWVRQGGVTVGYKHYLRDDVRDELAGNGYYFAGWYAPSAQLKFRAGYGAEQTDVNAGHTLVGDTERQREFASVRYAFRPGSQARLFVENNSRDNEEIGSSADYIRIGTDAVVVDARYGEMTLAYSYLDGEYEYSEGKFSFRDHVLSGDVTLPEYRKVTLSGGGSYVRSLEDTDVESFQVRLKASFALTEAQTLEFKYTAHNFDDLADIAPPYTRYYTANIVEISISSGL